MGESDVLEQATVVVRRGDDYFGAARRVRVTCDGEFRAAVKVGSEVEIFVVSVTHRVRACLGWCFSKSLELHLVDGQMCVVEVVLPFAMLWKMLVTPWRAIGLRQVS